MDAPRRYVQQIGSQAPLGALSHATLRNSAPGVQDLPLLRSMYDITVVLRKLVWGNLRNQDGDSKKEKSTTSDLLVAECTFI